MKVMLKQMICTALAVFVVTCTGAQSFGEIRGKVLDDKNEPIVGARIELTNGIEKSGQITNVEGVYRINLLRPGKYDLMITSLGMDTIRYKDVVINADIITYFPEVAMTLNDGEEYMYGPIDITYYVDPLISVDGDHIQTLRAEDLKHRPSTHGGRIDAIVGTMTSDIKPATDGAGMSIRGSREGDVLYMIDGVKVKGSNVVVPASGISSVSVYSGGIPAKYGDTTSGVVIVNTKSYTEEYYRMLSGN